MIEFEKTKCDAQSRHKYFEIMFEHQSCVEKLNRRR